MILKVLKEKSNQKFINTILSKRDIKVDTKKAQTIGVIFNAEEYTNYQEFSDFFKELNIQSPKQKFLTFSKTNDTQSLTWDNVYTPKDFGWKGKLKNTELQNFTNSNFDVLICYFIANDIELMQIAAMSKANFKVGISNDDERLYDLTISTKTSNFEVFKHEFKKYLTILKKI